MLIFLATIVCYLGMSIPLTLVVSRDELISASQRRIQILLIWLIPFLGAGFVFIARAFAYSPAARDTSEWRNDPNVPPEDFPHD